MPDGRIQYELTLDARRALTAVRALSAESSRAGAELAQIMQGAHERSARAAAGTHDMASGLKDAGNAADKMAKSLEASKGSVKHLSLLIGGMALDVGGAALKANGYAKEAGYLSSAGQSGLQMALTGAMMGGEKYGSKLGLAGAVIGTVAGGVKEYFSQQIAEADASKKKADDWLKSLNETTLAGKSLMASMGKIDSLDELQKALDQIATKINETREASKLGLIDPGIAKAQISSLQRIYRDNNARVAGMEEEASSDAAALWQKNIDMRIRDEKRATDLLYASVRDSREKSGFSESLADAISPGQKLNIIEKRQSELMNRIELALSAMNQTNFYKGSKETIDETRKQYEQAYSEYFDNERAANDIRRSLRRTSLPQIGVDQMGASGGYLRGSLAGMDVSMTSASADVARQTARNTAEMVTILRNMATRGGVTWQRR